MDKPNYVLKANEGVLVPKNENINKLKIPVWIIVGVIILGSIIFRDNLFSEFTPSTRILLIIMALTVTFSGGNKRIPSPFEIQFYDDHFIIYREKRFYNNKITRKEYNKFFYKDIYKIEYRTSSQRIHIKGIIEGIWYDYNKDGTLPNTPTYHKTTDGGICYFYTSEDTTVDFVSEIENHSPLKIEIVE